MLRLESLIPPDMDKNENNNIIVAEGLNDTKIEIFPFRPYWWPEYDSLTGKKILDDNET